jgi:hypothetical protein
VVVLVGALNSLATPINRRHDFANEGGVVWAVTPNPYLVTDGYTLPVGDGDAIEGPKNEGFTKPGWGTANTFTTD